MSGTLYLVSTPIGNLSDLSKRAAETLARVAVVAAEDTRRTRALLTHLGIAGKTLLTLDANAGERAVSDLVDRVVNGEDVAVVTDAGTPSVSDPGAHVVKVAASRGVVVAIVPGPSAVTAAVALSGLVDGPFTFLGFLPRKGEKRRHIVRRIAKSTEPVVVFEAPSRVRGTLEELARTMPDRAACVARELTKLHEEVLRGSLSELAERNVTELGEFTLVVAGAEEQDLDEELDLDALIEARLAAGDPSRTVAEDVAALSKKPRREIYARVLEARRRREG